MSVGIARRTARPVQCSSFPRSFDQPESEVAMQARIRAVTRWIDDEQGVTAIEYALLAAMFALAALASVVTLRDALLDAYGAVVDAVNTAMNIALGLLP
ncbi:Flp family type IVb pilin [Burkholderia sp. IMCC1007]|uniref:Flp family type IVb pilin n=1 Tax=Burkholderia sp. IMCC1007 TaxID=3004104 RepID=UPI002F969E93